MNGSPDSVDSSETLSANDDLSTSAEDFLLQSPARNNDENGNILFFLRIYIFIQNNT